MAVVKGGQRWEVVEPLDVGGVTMWRAPFTGGFRCTIPAGTVLTVESDPLPRATAVYCIPDDYAGVERVVVPEEDRRSEKYTGYALVILLDDFPRGLRLAP